jgi:hypothetical protein
MTAASATRARKATPSPEVILREPVAPRPVNDPPPGEPAELAPPGLPVPNRTELVPLALIGRDTRVNTRELKEEWLAKRDGKFSPAGLGVLAVSHRADGTYVVLDGQHRRELACRAGYGGDSAMVMCSVYEGLDLIREAGLVVLLNDGRPLKAINIFLARCTEEDPVATAIREIAERCSWRIGPESKPGVLVAVATLERIHVTDMKASSRRKTGLPVVLEETLSTIALAWGHDGAAVNQSIIGGVAACYLKYGPAIRKDDFAARLRDLPGGPENLYHRARGLREARGGTVAACVAELATDEYNKGRRSEKTILPRFRDPVPLRPVTGT